MIVMPCSRLQMDEQKRSSIEEEKVQVKPKTKKPLKAVDVVRRTSKDSGKLRRSPVQSEGDWSRQAGKDVFSYFFHPIFCMAVRSSKNLRLQDSNILVQNSCL